MTITTNINDVLPDGVITKLGFEAKDDSETILIVCLSRANVDKEFILDKVTVCTDKKELIVRAIDKVIHVLKENDVNNIEIEIVNAELM